MRVKFLVKIIFGINPLKRVQKLDNRSINSLLNEGGRMVCEEKKQEIVNRGKPEIPYLLKLVGKINHSKVGSITYSLDI